MVNRARLLGAVVATTALSLFCSISPGYSTTYNFITLNEPLGTPTGTAGTFTLGLNDAGDVVGYYYNESGVHGYLYSGGNYTTNNYPSALSTTNWDINNAGQIVGFASLSGGLQASFVYSGGKYTTISDPLGTNGTSATGINNVGQLVGYYEDSSEASHGFIYSGGNFTALDDPLATNGTFAYGINDKGQVVGFYLSGNGEYGFLYSGGIYTTLEFGSITYPLGINNAGQIVGESNAGGFLYSAGTFTVIADPLATSTDPRDINNVGQIAGMYYGTPVGNNDIVYGFLATPSTPLPAALPLFATGLGMMGLFGWRTKRKNAATLAAA